jgi:hypothetical protein
MPACKYCGKRIYFDSAFKSESGKFIPIDDETDEPHNCPNNPYNAGGGSGSGRSADTIDLLGIGYAIEKVEEHIAKINKNLLQLVLEVQKIGMKLEGQKTLDEN